MSPIFANFLFESPLLIIIVTALATVGLLFMFTQLRQKYYLIAGLAVAAAGGVLFYLAETIETDREQIARLTNEISLAIRDQDIPAVLERFHPDAKNFRKEAARELKHYKVTKLSIGTLTTTFNELASPPTAESRMRVHVAVKQGGGVITLMVTWRKTQEGWRVYEYRYTRGI